jgi:neutral ceramidase
MEFTKNNIKSGILFFLAISLFLLTRCSGKEGNIDVKVGVDSEEFTDADSTKQEGKLRAAAMVIEGDGIKLCIVSCDILFFRRDIIDEVGRKIESELGIPFNNILISATHTHYAPSTHKSFGVSLDDPFVKRLKEAIFLAVSEADKKLKTASNAQMYFWLGQEATVGQNSRMLLSDSTIFWAGRKDDAIRPSGTFDPELPVIAFKSKDEKLVGVMFNHSTHTLGSRKEGMRSPAFYGLAAQEMEEELGGTFLFLLGAHGSIHDLNNSTDEKVFRIKQAVKDALKKAQKREISKLVSVKEEFEFRVREFNEEEEENAVSYYCRHRFGNFPDIWPSWTRTADIEAQITAFRDRRHELAPHQGEVRKSWLQVMVIGDVAIVGVSGEPFNDLGLEIKRRSPFRYTYVVSLANDHIGYIPDKKGFELGGYQLWSGWISFVSKGTGEAIVDRATQILSELYNQH